jgi:hypothetical protein
MGVLHLKEPGKAGAEAHCLRLRSMNAGDQRLGDPLQDLPPETTGDERLEALVPPSTTTW